MLYSPRLRYIDANHVESRAQDLAGFKVVTLTGKKLGEFNGLIVDPPEGRIRYFVVRRGGWFGERRLLVPMSSARLDVGHRALQVELENDADCPTFEPEAFPPFSDDDLLAVMFRRRSTSVH